MDFTREERVQIFQDSNKFSAEYAHHAVTFAFYLNGAAATALFATGKTEFYPAAIFMGIGAALAVLCIGVSYVYILKLGDSWRADLVEKDGVIGFYSQAWGSDTFIPLRKVGRGRFVPAVLWGASVLCFFIGMGIAGWRI